MTTIRIKQHGAEHVGAILTWCTDTIGLDNYSVDFNFPSDYVSFNFSNNTHATVFKLRWFQ